MTTLNEAPPVDTHGAVIAFLGLAIATLLIVAWIVQGAHLAPWLPFPANGVAAHWLGSVIAFGK